MTIDPSTIADALAIFETENDRHDPARSPQERRLAAMEKAVAAVLASRSGAEPDFAASIAEVITEQSAGGAACGWRSCTGCHETNEGGETGRYPFSKMFGCHVGSGCSECGGLGVVWEYWSQDALDDMQRELATSPPDTDYSHLIAIIADIREKSGVGAKPMLSELADAIAAKIETAAQEK